MAKIVECVPNFSEGRDLNKINAVVSAARSVPGVVVLDVEKDADHNRTVLTFVAPLESAPEAMFRVIKKSSELIDLNFHKGEHPRMGATDVAPFIPIMGSTVEECIALAEKLGERVGRELNIPVYLYDTAARRPERKNLANVRKGQFEGLREEIGKNPDKTPDFGPNHIHPTAGAIAVGARQQIVNFNVNLDTQDMEFGKLLAKKIRTSGGGLPELRAKEIYLETKKQVQISTVLTNYRVTSVRTVMDAIEKEIAPKGIRVVNTELIGLTTQEALFGFAVETLKIDAFSSDALILENKLSATMGTWENGANSLIEALSDSNPTPGGGSAGAVSAAMGCALGMMAIGVSLKSKKIDEASKAAITKVLEGLRVLKGDLQACISEDSRAYDMFVEARKIDKALVAEREAKMQQALHYAAEVPLRTARLAHEVKTRLLPIEKMLSVSVGSDYRSSLYLLDAGMKCAAENVKINIGSLQDRAAASKMEQELASITA